jgi:hypothetical protein
LVPKRRQQRVLYFYFLDPALGLIYIRLTTWFPLTAQVYVNGHSWLEKQIRAANCSSRSVAVPVESFGRGDGVWSIARSAEADAGTYAPVASESSSVGSGERPGARGPLVGRDVDVGWAPRSNGRRLAIRQRGRRPAGASAYRSVPQLGHRFASAATGRLHRAGRRPRSAGYGVEARSESSVTSGELSHKS